MIPEWRRAYNSTYSDERYQGYVRSLTAALGHPVDFRLAETPVFLDPELLERAVDAAREIVAELLAPDRLERSKAAVPARFAAPGPSPHPLFAQVDFAVTTNAHGAFLPRLIELQAFPSLYGFQLFQARELRRIVPGGEGLVFLLSGLDEEGYVGLLGQAVLGGHDPDDVVLMDLAPESQKTACDFAATEKLLGVRAVCPTRLEKRGRELWAPGRDGKPRRVLRIYNRLIVDEVEAKQVALPFDWGDDLAVEWAHHPDWYFRWSKHSLPELRHPAVPEARLLAELDAPPADLERWVLKPLFSFAGQGVKIEPTAADLEAIAEADRASWLLMRKVEYAPVVETVDGNRSKAELRVMIIWRGDEPVPATTLVRLLQGKMAGVDHNKDRTWVGSSCGLWPAS